MMYRLVRKNHTFYLVEESHATGDLKLIKSTLFPRLQGANWGRPSTMERHPWDDFVKYGKARPHEVNERILNSWKRCRTLEIDPVKGKCDQFLSEKELFTRNNRLMEMSEPIIRTLYHCLHGSDTVIVLIDSDGYIVTTCGDLSALRQADKLLFGPGANWSEGSVGTNAIGTAIALASPIQVTGAEHYCETHHLWTCAAAPIRDHTGEVTGFIDISGPREEANPHQLALIVAAARAIEERSCLNYSKEDLCKANKYLEAVLNSMGDGVIATNAQGIITGINKVAAKTFCRLANEIIGRSLSEFVQMDELLDDFFKTGRSYSQESLILKTPKGMVECIGSANPVFPELGVDRGAVLTLTKIERTPTHTGISRPAERYYTFKDIIGESKSIRRTIEQAKQVAQSPSNILILGESGTGKEVLAQAIHNASDYRHGPFVAINCGAIAKDLIQSELFGYAGGAFTGAKRSGSVGKFQVANGGTLFLDEIGEMPYEMQINLLRVLEEKTVVPVGGKRTIPVDVRIVAATNKGLYEEVAEGKFREDLYYRLNVISISLPPLRARKGDIRLLTEYYVRTVSRKVGKEITHVDERVFAILDSHDWPGNVRELINAVEYAVNFARTDKLLPRDLPRYLRNQEGESEPTDSYQIMRLTAVEKNAIQRTLRHFRGNISRTARALGIGRNTLYEKIRRYRIHY